jgi:hypothetical protein
VNPFLLLSISQRDYEIKLGLRISAVGESLQFYFSAKQEHSSRLKQRADFLRILLKNRLEGKRGEIGPNSELVGVINRRWLNELFPRTSGIIIDRRILVRPRTERCEAETEKSAVSVSHQQADTRYMYGE